MLTTLVPTDTLAVAHKKSESSHKSWKLSRKSSSPVAKPVRKVSAKKRMSRDVRDSLLMDDSVKPPFMGSSEKAHTRHNLIMRAHTPPIWTPPWVPGGDLYGRHNLAIVGSSVQDHTMHNLLVGARTPPIWTSLWVPAGDLKMHRRHNPLMGPRMKSV